MGPFDWDEEKNARLLRGRGVSFEDVVLAVAADGLLDDLAHPNEVKFGRQRVLVVRLGEQAYAVPYVQEGERIFLKTIYPSRKLTRRYLMEDTNEEKQ